MTSWTLLESLPTKKRDEVLAAAARRRYAPGDVLFLQGEHARSLHLIDRGRVAARLTTPTGHTVTVEILVAGDVIGELALLMDDSRRSATAVALEPVETLVLDAALLDEARRRHPLLDRALFQCLGDRVRQLDRRLVEALYVAAPTRVRRRLLELTEEYGPTVPLRQEDLAGLAGTTRATVNRTLRRAEAAGLVTLGRSRVVVLDAEALRRLTG